MSLLTYLNFFADFIRILVYAIWLIPVKLIGSCVPTRPKSLKDEIILVTGGANGIGREICLELVKKEVEITIIIWDVDEVNIEKVINELKALNIKKAIGFKVDISDRQQIKNASEQIRTEIGGVTMLFNNAGIGGELQAGWLVSPEVTEKVLDVNMTSHCWTILEILPSMINKGKGHVVETCSILGFIHHRDAAAYVASKHGLKAYAECIKQDLRYVSQKPQVYFTIVYPHFTSTNLIAKFNLRPRKYPFLIPKYTPHDVAQRVVSGVLRNEEHIFFPSFYRWGPMCIGLWPSEIYNRIMDMLDLQHDDDKKSGSHIV